MKRFIWHIGIALLLLITVIVAVRSCRSTPQIVTPNWTPFLDPSRAIDWTSAGFSIPNYTVNCSTQPTLATGSGAAAANRTAIENALNSCDATHNVVNIPAGTWYVTSVSFGSQGQQVLRGVNPKLTTLIPTVGAGCGGGLSSGLCLKDGTGYYNGSGPVQPGGSNSCSWTAGYAQGSTTLTFASCGSTPPLNQTIILDQNNDTSATSGVYVCDTNSNNCGYESNTGGNNNGRTASGVTRSQQQVVKVTGVTFLGGGGYTVTISPGVYFTNIRSGQSPGAWWPGFVANDGVENMTIDGSAVSGGSNISMYDCYNCWVKNVRSLNAGRNHVDLYQSGFDVIRDSYFFGSQGSGSDSYAVEFGESSGVLVEDNIFQQVTTPTMFGAGTGSVIGYNYAVNVKYTCGGGCPSFGNGAYASHNAGNNFNLFEGNNFYGIWGDDAWGSATQDTYFRNMLAGWQNGKTQSTFPIMMRAYIRDFNIVGNVMGQPGYHNQYQAIATSTAGGTGAANENTSIYSIGWAGTGATCSSGFVTQCDPLGGSTLMRWGNYDTVTAAAKWDANEASPNANSFVSSNFSSAYFTSLAHTLPASLYYAATPSWWPAGKNFPAVGPDVTTGNVGTCTGTYAGSQATSSSQCTGGTLSTAWASHTTSTPAQDCYLSMNGTPDGTGSVLSFDASTCYAAGPGTVATPTYSPAAGTFPSPQSVAISTTTPSASIYYTLDGTLPIAPPPATPTIFSISTTSASNDPSPYPPVVRCCIGVSWDKIETARGVYDASAFASVDSWIARAQAHGSQVMFSGNYTPTWASGAAAGDLSKAPSDWNTTATCQAPLAGVSRRNCFFAEYYTKFMQHICGVTSQPSSPLIGQCKVKFHEVRNEINVGRYWTSPMPPLGRLANDQAKIIRLYCGDCVVVGGSASAGGSGTGGAYTSSLLSFYQAWQAEGTTQPPFAKPDMLSFHAYPVRTPTIDPAPFVTSIVSHSDPTCTVLNTPNTSCTVALMSQTPTLRSSVACNASISSWACALPIISTEGGWGRTNVISDGIDGNSANSTLLRVAYVSQYMIALQGSGTAAAFIYSWDDPCWAPHQGNSRHCSGDPNLPVGNLPWQAAFTATQTWLQNSVFSTTAPTGTSVSGGKVWTWNITYKGVPGQYVWFDGWLASTTYTLPGGMFYAQYLNGPLLAGASAITISQKPTLVYANNTAQLYSSPVTVPATMTIKSVGAKSGMLDSSVNSGLFTITTAAPSVADPVFAPVAGPYATTQNVAITSTTPGATICVTNNGTTPSTSAPGSCLNGTPYSGTIPVSSTTTLKAIATKAAMTDSAVITATYTISALPVVASPVFAPAGGPYTSTQNVGITSATPGATICTTNDGSTPTAGPAGSCLHGTAYSGTIPVSSTTTLKAIATKAAMTDSAVITATYTITIPPPTVAAPSFSPPGGTYNSTQNIALNSITPGASICYTLNGTTPTATVPGTCDQFTYASPIPVSAALTIKAMATKSGAINSGVVSATYSFSAALPVLTPAAGGYGAPVTVAITSTTPGATICVTTNGTTPAATVPGTCSTGTAYTVPIYIGTNTTIRALATLATYSNSPVVTGTYTINIPAIITSGKWTFSGNVTVTVGP